MIINLPKNGRLLLFTLALLVERSDAAGVTSKLQIHIPKELSKAGGYDHREALFGVPPYGGSIQQNVYYANSDLCDPNVDVHSGFPKRKVDEATGKMPAWTPPFVLMVDRGDCTFVKKVRNAQRAGAAGVIIADNTCLCSAGDDCKSDGDELCETREPVMADDGSGSDISIPSFLMFKQDADPIKAVLKKDQAVRVEMAWSLPNPDDRVEYDLFTTPLDSVSKSIQESFKMAAVALGQHAKFTPHMYIYDGVKAGCQGLDGENQCYNLCTNNGRYCATDPDDDLDSGTSGADIVKESLRRVCIWNLYGKDGIGEPWWDYVVEFMHRCKDAKFFNNDDCIKDAMEHTGVVDFKHVSSCMDDAGGLDGDVTNAILESQLSEKEASGVVIIPSFYVNNAAIRGALSFQTVLKAICAGFAVGSAPEVCTRCANCLDEYGCVADKGHCKAESPNYGTGINQAVPASFFGATMLIVIFIFSCCGLCMYRRQQLQMRDQVRGILAEYMPLDENNKIQQDTSVGLTDEGDDGEFT